MIIVSFYFGKLWVDVLSFLIFIIFSLTWIFFRISFVFRLNLGILNNILILQFWLSDTAILNLLLCICWRNICLPTIIRIRLTIVYRRSYAIIVIICFIDLVVFMIINCRRNVLFILSCAYFIMFILLGFLNMIFIQSWIITCFLWFDYFWIFAWPKIVIDFLRLIIIDFIHFFILIFTASLKLIIIHFLRII